MIEIKPRELIKPSSPTPLPLKSYHISFLDQFISVTYAPILLFYPPPPRKQVSIYNNTQLLKQSLPKTLSLYYPLAGVFKDHLSIDCNDQGVHYIEATINSTSNDYFNNLKISSLAEFMPEKIIDSQLKQDSPVCMIQVAEFSCGGFAIGVVVSHLLFDGPSLVTFLKTWASFCREHSHHQFPDFTSSHIFPQNREFPPNLTLPSVAGSLLRKGNYVLRRFVFDGTAITHLKSKAITSGLHNPSRSEVVQALFFKSIMSAMKAKSVLVVNSVNIRRRAVPSLPESFVGNFVPLAGMICTEDETELCGYVKKMRETTSAINGEFMRKLEGEEGFATFMDYLKGSREMIMKARDSDFPVVMFNSWCNIGSHDVDFGWGKPVWVPPLIFANPIPGLFIQLMDVRQGNGIEAWVLMDEQHMSVLMDDRNFVSLVSLDPNPLQIGLLVSNL